MFKLLLQCVQFLPGLLQQLLLLLLDCQQLLLMLHLGQCLGGRVEPLGETVRQSTAQIVHGAEHLPGLVDAMKK